MHQFRWSVAFLLRGFVFASLWWAALGTEPASWMVGAPAVVGSAVVSLWLLPPLRIGISLISLLATLPKMLWRALSGGWDVSRRVISPRPDIDPSMIRYPLRLKGSAAQWSFVHAVSLLPGTASAVLESEAVLIHVLADLPSGITGLEALEADIAAIFHQTLH